MDLYGPRRPDPPQNGGRPGASPLPGAWGGPGGPGGGAPGVRGAAPAGGAPGFGGGPGGPGAGPGGGADGPAAKDGNGASGAAGPPCSVARGRSRAAPTGWVGSSGGGSAKRNTSPSGDGVAPMRHASRVEAGTACRSVYLVLGVGTPGARALDKPGVRAPGTAGHGTAGTDRAGPDTAGPTARTPAYSPEAEPARGERSVGPGRLPLASRLGRRRPGADEVGTTFRPTPATNPVPRACRSCPYPTRLRTAFTRHRHRVIEHVERIASAARSTPPEHGENLA
jgi:hypothetical protein